jgi:plastocyanin
MGRGALILLLSLAAPLAAAQQGTVRGEVRVTVPGPDGRPVPKADRSGVVVYLTGYTEPPPAGEVNMAQRNKAFQPSVMAVVAGQKVRFSNNDVVVHNVFSRSRAGKFDAGKNRPGEDYTETFKKTGIVDVYCDIHEQMVATLVVVPNRAVAVTGPDGRFVLTGVPPGTWPLFAVHRRDERSDVSRTEVTVKPGQETTVTLELTETRADDSHADKRGRPYSSHPDGY